MQSCRRVIRGWCRWLCPWPTGGDGGEHQQAQERKPQARQLGERAHQAGVRPYKEHEQEHRQAYCKLLDDEEPWNNKTKVAGAFLIQKLVDSAKYNGKKPSSTQTDTLVHQA